LATWVWNWLVNRTDVWGGYSANGQVTQPAKSQRGRVTLCSATLQAHFETDYRQGIVGLHAASSANLSKWCALDIDYHGEGGNEPEQNERAAMHWYDELCQLGSRPLLTDSNGAGGYHLLTIFREPVSTADAFIFARWVTGDFADFGFKKRPECFPKQREVAPVGQNGQYGNWLRLPGMHHSRKHWSRVWNGSQWLAGDDAIDHILAIEGDDPAILFSPRIVSYAKKIPNLGAGEGRDDAAFNYAAFLTRDLNLPDEVSLDWLHRWDIGNTPPKGDARLAEILKNAQAYGRNGYGSGINRPHVGYRNPAIAAVGPSQIWSRSTPPLSPAAPSGQRCAWEIIRDYFRVKYKPAFRDGDSIHSGSEEREVRRNEACVALPPDLIGPLCEACDMPRHGSGGPAKGPEAMPGFFKKWAGTGWSALLAELPDEDSADLDAAGTELAAEQFRRLMREALLTEVVLGDVMDGTSVTQVRRASLIDWCRTFAKPGPWRSIRSKRCWCKCDVKEGGEIVLRVAIRHELFSQLKADRRLCEMGQNKFARRAERYKVGHSTRDERPGGRAAVVLSDEFLADLTSSIPNDESDRLRDR
jgi:hypothetical protein